MDFKVSYMHPSKVKPYFRNVKKHAMKQITQLASVIAKYGFDQPIVVDKDMVIIKGHGRYMAAIRLELAYVPVIVRKDLSEGDAKASRIADNRMFDLGSTDTILEKSEILDFVGAGGSEMGIFDFVPLAEKPQGLVGGVKRTTIVATHSADGAHTKGKLVICPKCNVTTWEDGSGN